MPGAGRHPELGPLENNGGPTHMIAVPAGSAVVEQAPPTDPLYCPATDQLGVTRPQASNCDIGAYEAQPGLVMCPLCGQVFASLSLAPRFFNLKLHGTETRGATVIEVLHKPRVLVLLVRKFASHDRLLLVGLVRLGHHHTGRSLIHWNLRVSGRLLGGGRYQIVMYALDDNVLSLPANPGARTLIVLQDGRARVGR